jgi:hypothetical protein
MQKTLKLRKLDAMEYATLARQPISNLVWLRSPVLAADGDELALGQLHIDGNLWSKVSA